jgi:hypothetical protein
MSFLLGRLKGHRVIEHATNISVDSALPAVNIQDQISSEGYNEGVQVAIHVTGTGAFDLTFVPYWLDEELGIWLKDTSQSINITGTNSAAGTLGFVAPLIARGAPCFLMLTAKSGAGTVTRCHIRAACTRSRTV